MNNEEDIFEAAAALPPEGRPAYLDAACANQPEMRARIEALLRSHDATGFMQENPVVAGSPHLKAEGTRSQPEEAGQRIGNYKLLEQIGEGGFGVVWVAEQLEPVRRRVALKIIKPGMDSREVVGRFEQERQALAMMDHPNIAKVFDAGATDKGRPYFVMELVRGVKITDYCDKENLPTAERLKLLITVCQAVQHAHQKGIIHRDLKPSNILVTPGDDGEPVPKVIDFGVAKAIQQQSLTDGTVYTQFEQMIGTPAYMSPEQAGLGPMDIDTRSDVYSLGVLLYELLTGRPPFDPKELLNAGLDEMRRVIREVEPPKPSTRISSLTAKELSGTAARRHIEAPKLASAIRGDLDWIAMKALEKNRSRRYESATSLAADIERYLTHEPVTAAAPGVTYIFRKFARRHRAALGMAAFIALVLVAATGISLWQAKLIADALGEVEKKNAQYRAILAEADRSDRAIADGMLRAGLEREAFAHLARACEYEPLSMFAAQKAVVVLNKWQSPLPVTILEGHERGVRSAQYSPNGAYIVTASRDKTARVWDAATGKCLVTLAGHEGVVLSAQFSRDDSRIVTGSEDRTARVWDVATGNVLATLAGHESEVCSARFSPDGARIVTASWNKDNTARVWDATTGKMLATLAGHKDGVWDAQFSLDGARIVTASEDKTARVWDAATGLSLVTLAGHENSVCSAQFSQDGSRIVTASLDKTARVWDAATGWSLATLAGHEGDVASAWPSLNGAHILKASEDKTPRIFRVDFETGKGFAIFSHYEGRVTSARFSRNGARIITMLGDKTVRVVWDAATFKWIRTGAGFEGNVTSAQFSPDGLHIVTTASDDRTARVWDTPTGKSLGTLAGWYGGEISPDGSRIFTPSLDETDAQVWDVATGKYLAMLAGLKGEVDLAHFSPDGAYIATVSENDTVARVWDVATGKSLATLTGHEGGVNSVQFSPDGTRIITVSREQTARLWDALTGRSLVTLPGRVRSDWSAQFSRDGSRFVTVPENDTVVRVWDVATGKSLATLAGHELVVWSVQFSRDGSRIVTASPDKTARVWDAATGKCLATLAGHEDAVTSAEFSPDGSRIVSVSRDKTARVWDTATGQSLATLAGHEDGVTSAEFSTNGSHILTASEDKAARVWDAATGQCLATLAGHEGGVNSSEFSPDGSLILTASSDGTARVWDAATWKCLATLAGENVTNAQFTPDGAHIITAGFWADRIWTILPTTAGPPPAWFADFLRYMAQMRLNYDGEPEPLKPSDWLALRERLRAVQRASAGKDTPYLRILRRFVSE